MASQSSHEARAALLILSTDGEPAAGDPCDSSPDPNVDSKEALEKQGDQPESPNPGLHDNLPPQGQNPEMANEEENNAVLGLSQEALEDHGGCGLHLCALEQRGRHGGHQGRSLPDGGPPAQRHRQNLRDKQCEEFHP